MCVLSRPDSADCEAGSGTGGCPPAQKPAVWAPVSQRAGGSLALDVLSVAAVGADRRLCPVSDGGGIRIGDSCCAYRSVGPPPPSSSWQAPTASLLLELSLLWKLGRRRRLARRMGFRYDKQTPITPGPPPEGGRSTQGRFDSLQSWCRPGPAAATEHLAWRPFPPSRWESETCIGLGCSGTKEFSIELSTKFREVQQMFHLTGSLNPNLQNYQMNELRRGGII